VPSCITPRSIHSQKVFRPNADSSAELPLGSCTTAMVCAAGNVGGVDCVIGTEVLISFAVETGLDLFQLVALHPDRRRALDSMDRNRKAIIFKLSQHFRFMARACLDGIPVGLGYYRRSHRSLANVAN